jgi:hypothetical protein
MESHKYSMFQTTNQSLYVGFAWGIAWVHPHHGGTSWGQTSGSKKDTEDTGVPLFVRHLFGKKTWEVCIFEE